MRYLVIFVMNMYRNSFMPKLLFIFFIFSCARYYAQETDSLYILTFPVTRDSLMTSSDTVGVIVDTAMVEKADSAAVKIDSLIPIYYSTQIDSAVFSLAYSSANLEMTEYRNTADWFNYFPGAYYRDPGYFGQPGEVLLYGSGWGESGYYADGLLLNNRFNNSFILNEFLSESADSVEIAPLPRGFLYGTTNNSAAVNFITKDFISKEPYSRIRFYQAPNEEGFIDAQFNAYIYKKLNLFAEIENNSIDEFLENTWFGQWKAAVKLKYYQSNSLNIIGRYNYLKSNARLFGGINSQELIGEDFVISNDIQSAPVRYPLRYMKNTAHTFSLSFLMKHSSNIKGELTGYYMSRLAEHRNNESDTSRIYGVYRDNESDVYGAKLKERFASDNLQAGFEAAYERAEIKAASYSKGKTSTLSASADAGISIMNNLLHPSVFGKILRTREKTYTGFGADVTADIRKSFRLYAGASLFQKPLDEYERLFSGFNSSPDDRQNTNLQAGGTYKSGVFSAGASVFIRKINNNLMPAFRNDTLYSYSAIEKETITGANLNLKLKLWKFFIEGSGNLYDSDFDGNFLPDYNGFGSLYFQGILFDNALDLKTGFNITYSLGQKYFYYNYESGRASNLVVTDVPSFEMVTNTENIYFDENAFKLDLFLIGKIQKRAILYFIFENILNRNIFIIPEYPLQSGGIRLGFAWELFN